MFENGFGKRFEEKDSDTLSAAMFGKETYTQIALDPKIRLASGTPKRKEKQIAEAQNYAQPKK